MLNIEDFIRRLEIILDYYTLNASSFADKIGVQRSSLSHLLSGRNKPSLDFILKIMDVFPEVDLYWLLNGIGNFPKSEVEKEVQNMPPTPIVVHQIVTPEIEKQVDLFSEKNSTENIQKEEKQSPSFSNTKIAVINKLDREIDRIVIFYTNGTFKTYSAE